MVDIVKRTLNLIRKEVFAMTRKEYIDKYSVGKITNNLNEVRYTTENSIVFNNGRVASIVETNGVKVYSSDGEHLTKMSDKKYSVATCDYNGFFDFEILNKHGGIQGCIYCDTEEEIQAACDIIRSL